MGAPKEGMRAALFLALGLVTATLALAPAADAAAPVRLVAFGDDGTTASTQKNVDGALADGARGYVGLGDYYYWADPAVWKSMFRPLTSQAAYLALGNHDDLGAMADVMGPDPTWSRLVNGARLVSINTEQRMDVGSPQWNEVRGALCNAPEATRILVLHKAWWLTSGARHPGTEFPGSAAAMDQMVKDCGVDLVLAGHEHNYQRMVRNGASYLIVGTGGQGIYPVAGSPAGTVASCACYGRLILDVSPEGYSAHFKALDGSVKDAFSTTPGSAPSTAPPASGTFSATFTPTAANAWWAQVKVQATAAPSGVDVRVNGGAWKPLALRSWGDWATSTATPAGSIVQFQAHSGADAALSGCYRWTDRAPTPCPVSAPAPATTPSPAPAASTYAATFRNARGNAWWVEADVDAADLAKVETRVDGGAWVALPRTSWGSYAKSLYAAEGSTVEFRATSSTGAAALSTHYRWIPR